MEFHSAAFAAGGSHRAVKPSCFSAGSSATTRSHQRLSLFSTEGQSQKNACRSTPMSYLTTGSVLHHQTIPTGHEWHGALRLSQSYSLTTLTWSRSVATSNSSLLNEVGMV